MSELDYLIELNRRRAITQSFIWKIARPFWRLEKTIKTRFSKAARPCSLPDRAAAQAGAIPALLLGGLGDRLVSAAFLHKLGRQRKLKFAVYTDGRGHLDYITRGQVFLQPGGSLEQGSAHEAESITMNHAIIEVAESVRQNHGIRNLVQSLPFDVMIEHHAKFDGTFAEIAKFFGYDRYSVMAWQSGLDFSQADLFPLQPDIQALSCFAKHHLRPNAYFTLGGGVDQVHYEGHLNKDPDKITTKQLTAENWNRVIALVRTLYPGLPLVAMGANGPKVNADLDLRGATTLEEAAWLLKFSCGHLDIEGGLVHLAHHLSTRSLVFFGPTPQHFFGYSDNVNIVSDACSNCFWKSDTWMFRCPKGFAQPICLKDLDEKKIADGLPRIIKQKKKLRLLKLRLFSGDNDLANRRDLGAIAQSAKLSVPTPGTDAHGEVSGTYIQAGQQWAFPTLLQEIRAQVGDGQLKLAELGSGRGALSSHLAQLGHQVALFNTHYEVDAPSAQASARFAAWCETLGIQQEYASGYNLPARENFFSCAIAPAAMGPAKYNHFALLELARIVAPGGLVLLNFYIGNAKSRNTTGAEILRPKTLHHLLEQAGVGGFSPELPDLDKSLAEIHQAGVQGIAAGVTMGILVVKVE